MVTFAAKADRRAPIFSKDVLSPREAGIVYVALAGGDTLQKAELEQLFGSAWEKKVGKFKASETALQVVLEVEKLHEFAKTPVSPAEMASMVSGFFRGAGKALAFLQGRMKNPNLDQNLSMSQETVEKALGPLWRERLDAAGVAYAA